MRSSQSALVDGEGKVVLEFTDIQDIELKEKLISIANGLDSIVPPPGPEFVPSPEPKKQTERVRKPRGISILKKLSYQVIVKGDQ